MRVMSRKPRTFAVLLLMAVFLMVNVAVAGAASIVMGPTTGTFYSDNSVTGTIYASNAVYSQAYAVIDGNLRTTPVGYAYNNGTGNLSIPLTNLSSGSHNIALWVYENADLNLAIAQGVYAYAYAPFNINVGTRTPDNSGSSSSGGSSNPTPTVNTPSVSISFGTPQSVSATNGATLNGTGITIAIPAGALAADVKVTVTKVADTAGLKLDADSKLLSDVLEIVKDKTGDFIKPVTITLNFDKSKVDTTKFDVKVCFYDETNKKWVALDKINLDAATGKVSGEVTHFTKFAVLSFPKAAVAPAGLKDISGHWAEANIKKLVELGAISGYPDGTFKPNATITRAEFATILVKAFKLAPSTSKVFADTANHWAKADISAAAAAGIVNGYSATQFGPNDQITREQMAVMIAKAAKLAAAKNGKTFADKAQISAWASAAIASASENGIISGYPDNSFKPKATATRAEAVTVIVKALK